MLKTLMISAAVSALMVSGAFAQADMSPKQSAAKPEAVPHDTAKFISSQSQDQWVFSKFKGSDVLGPDDAHIGEKNVAIDMSAFQPVPASTGSSTTSGGSAITTRSDDPTMTKLKVTWTKDQLKNAPDFQYYKPPARTTGAPGGSPTTGMAPRPTSPGPSSPGMGR